MAYAQKRGTLWRARWRGPDGHLESKPGFQTRKAAEEYGRDQEAAIRNNTYVDVRGRITLLEWVNVWFPGPRPRASCADLTDAGRSSDLGTETDC
jgi:hypothetical protein